jgi:hypothetical protein
MWTTLRLAHTPQEQNQKKRTYDALPKPDNLIRYRQEIALKRQAELRVRLGRGLRRTMLRLEASGKPIQI